MSIQKIETSTLKKALIWPFFILVTLWLIQWAQHLFLFDFYKLGVQAKTIEGLKGIIFMPLIHSKADIQHLLNNSLPIFILLATLIHFYEKIAFKIFTFLWIFTGIFTWIFAQKSGVYHIGISGVIYGLAAFLFFSGTIRKVLQLQAISLFVVFVYGSLVWGLFPVKQGISWEGHLSGFIVGLLLAFIYKGKGTQRQKLQYEIEKEMGIEPPDLEGIYHEKLRIEQALREQEEHINRGHYIVYHYIPNEKPKE